MQMPFLTYGFWMLALFSIPFGVGLASVHMGFVHVVSNVWGGV